MPDYPKLDANGEATIMRGFATSIQRLKRPTLKVVTEIGEGIGLAILRSQDLTELRSQNLLLQTELTDSTVDTLALCDGYKQILDDIKLVVVSNSPSDIKVEQIIKMLTSSERLQQ